MEKFFANLRGLAFSDETTSAVGSLVCFPGDSLPKSPGELLAAYDSELRKDNGLILTRNERSIQRGGDSPQGIRGSYL